MPVYRIGANTYAIQTQHPRGNGGTASSGAANTASAVFNRGAQVAVIYFKQESRSFANELEAPAGGNVIVDVDTAGRITWTGSSVTLAYKEVITGGTVTWTGSTTITLVHGIGALTAGAITWTGSAVPLKIGVTVTGGVITWTGSSIVLKLGIGVTAGVITWSGSTTITLATGGGTTVVVDTPGTITWTGSSVTLAQQQVVTAGVITWTGSSVVLAQKQVVTAGVITWTGSSITLAYKIIPTAGVVTWTGSAVVLKTQITPTAGVITWTGSTAITLVAGGNVVVSVTTPGVITWIGATTITLVESGASIGAPVKGPTRKLVLTRPNALDDYAGQLGIDDDPFILVDDPNVDVDGNAYIGALFFPPIYGDQGEVENLNGDENDVDELLGAPRAVLIGAGHNDLAEV